MARELKAFRPHAIHVATEGPLGLAVRRYCRARGVPFTTSYHTRYPEYLRARWPIPLAVTYAWLRRFHGAAARTFVSSATLEAQLRRRGFGHLHLWRRGVDLRRFHPAAAASRSSRACRGRSWRTSGGSRSRRTSTRSSASTLAGTKLVIGDGPQRAALAARYPRRAVHRLPPSARSSPRCSPRCDVLVFPSLTDTFGLAMIEALACGVPVAAFPVPGPLDVIEQGVTGVLHPDLRVAIGSALRLDRRVCAERAAAFSWEAATAQFLAGLAPIPVALRAGWLSAAVPL